jgi:hypothetical protein
MQRENMATWIGLQYSACISGSRDSGARPFGDILNCVPGLNRVRKPVLSWDTARIMFHGVKYNPACPLSSAAHV